MSETLQGYFFQTTRDRLSTEVDEDDVVCFDHVRTDRAVLLNCGSAHLAGQEDARGVVVAREESRGHRASCKKNSRRMGLKKPRVDPEAWLLTVVEVLLGNGRCISHERLYEMTCTRETSQTESLLIEHPSIVLEHGHVYFEPFCVLGDQTELLQMLRAQFPRGYRRSDLCGLYSFVLSDVAELIYRGQIVVLDGVSGSICAPPDLSVDAQALRDAWNMLNATG